MAGVKINPETDIPSLAGNVVSVTGELPASGKESVLQFVKQHLAHIYFSGRKSKSAAAVIDEIQIAQPDTRITFLECDLACLASVSKTARQLTSQSSRLDIFLCNAGIIVHPLALNSDGFEIQFGTNHVGHALLIKLLLPTLQRTVTQLDADVRIVSNTSLGFKDHPSNDIAFDDLRTKQKFPVIGH